MKVKILKETFYGKLEEKINEFINQSDCLVRDVKYQDGDTGCSAMILYHNLD